MPTSMDHSKYRYENFEGRPNVWVGYHLSATDAKRCKVDRMVLETARILFTRAPKNTYIFTGPMSGTAEVANMSTCTIEQNDEVIGKLSAAYGRKGSSVCVDNDRVRATRERGGGMITSDAKRAAALAMKKFITTSPEENMMKQYETMFEALRQLPNIAMGRKRTAMETSAQRVMQYVDKHWPKKGMALLEQAGVPASAIAELDGVVTESKQYDSLRKAGDKGLTYIMQRGDTLYAVPYRLNDRQHDLHQRSFPFADAPDDMRAKLGMLKVAEANTYIKDVGYKIGDTSFVIFFDLDATAETSEGVGEDGGNTASSED